MEGPGVRPVDNETQSRTSRTTKDGRKYTYKLTVIQQPSRARACGSGAKSSADRRPVDPPPIVELKIFEGHGDENELKDVTFSMSSNYFLFATLEQARNVAHGRVQQSQNQLTVLTGTPVAGMVYLDRPTPAGYFIFPDLSVRHEGKYRLSFNLYEELKDVKDEDQGSEAPKQPGSVGVHVTHRLEVKSIPFTVFSAKKFPGLTESTALSRVVAEQGCRVRIRRDVRMRRRDTKNTKDWDGYEDETAEARARMSATPEVSGYPTFPPSAPGLGDPIARPRSGSNASHHSLAPSLSRRPSLQDINPGFHQPSYGTAPQTPQSAYPQSSPYGPGPSPGQQYSQPPFMQQHAAMQPPPPPPVASSHQSHFGFTPAPSLPGYESAGPHQRSSVDYPHQVTAEYRRASNQYVPALSHQPQQSYAAPPPPLAYHTPAQPSYQQAPPPQSPYSIHNAQHSSYGSSDSYNRAYAPAEPIQPPARPLGAHTPLSSRPPFNDKLPPLNTTLSMITNRYIEPASPSSSTQQNSYHSSGQSLMDTNKRQFGQVFNDRHLSQPLRQGARPSTPGYGHTNMTGIYTAVDDEEPEAEHDGYNPNVTMAYRRADGREIVRDLPPHS